MTQQRRLIVLRHAKADWPDVPDELRPLAERGRADAVAAGRWLAGHDLVPDRVLCSTAVRTRQTWELAEPELGGAPELVLEPRAYRAEADELIGLLRELPSVVRTVLLVGHRPEVQELVLELAGGASEAEPDPEATGSDPEAAGSDPEALERLRAKFSTAGIAVLAIPGEWNQLVPGSAELTDFVVPRG
ncbi:MULTISPECIES: histidine phosphatase family protein [Kitasatospora]|uniref:Putative phosphohistidine phosphatase n=1 Tax=Kitasatospora setae (strain ATCC 33774 / DSM 43861 / JCM 3304 / KCC A-0304 / NBRC 14216 / KM-6054) TaxID=452652 RepID=E4NE86_KITSK|nr:MULTISPECIES: histidine phosphatase family protein [Kitasatospora]BAJ29517.1 putative phosphohistidine phosphatase [Kitasatospora setae KM-6054]